MPPKKNNPQKPILIVGPDTSVNDTYYLAKISHPDREISKLIIPTTDYFIFDFSGINKFSPEIYSICTSTNEFYLNHVRKEFHEKLFSLGFKEESIVSPLAYIHEDAYIEEGCIIHSGCSIESGVKIGKKSVLRPNVSVANNCNIGQFVTLESNVSVRELVSIGSNTLISANSSIARNVKIGEYCYLNQQKQYKDSIPSYTSISAIFENPVRSYIN